MDSRKTVLITGCSPGGSGEAFAKSFYKKGLRVFATARNTSKIEHLRDLGIEVVQLDVTDAASLKTAVEKVSKLADGQLDYLVSNAGGGMIVTFSCYNQMLTLIRLLRSASRQRYYSRPLSLRAQRLLAHHCSPSLHPASHRHQRHNHLHRLHCRSSAIPMAGPLQRLQSRRQRPQQSTSPRTCASQCQSHLRHSRRLSFKVLGEQHW